MAKYINPFVWYKDIEVKDPYRSHWKRKIIRKAYRGMRRNKQLNIEGKLRNNKSTTTSIFVPWTPKDELAGRIKTSEEKCSGFSDWKVKVQVKSGTPLINMLQLRIPIISGCPQASSCTVCEQGNGVLCSKKNLVYQAECTCCMVDPSKNVITNDGRGENRGSDMCPSDQIGRGGTNIKCPNDRSDRGGTLTPSNKVQPNNLKSDLVVKQIYVGETSRTLRTRVKEHLANVRLLKTDSFILNHWFSEHPEMQAPPTFKFKMVKRFNEAFGRQLMEAILIVDRGTLNSKFEYGINKLCRLDNSEAAWKTNEEHLKQQKERREYNQGLKSFIVIKSSVMSNKALTNMHDPSSTNHIPCSRYKFPEQGRLSRKREHPVNTGAPQAPRAKTRRMESSTPVQINTVRECPSDPDLESPILSLAPARREFTNDSTGGETIAEDELEQVPQSKKKTDLSDDLTSSKIGSAVPGNNSSTEYAVGAISFQNAAIMCGILDSEGAAPTGNDLLQDVEVDKWNSSSNFSETTDERIIDKSSDNGAVQYVNNVVANLDDRMNSNMNVQGLADQDDELRNMGHENYLPQKLIDHVGEGKSDSGCPVDLISRGGVINICPNDQIGRGGSNIRLHKRSMGILENVTPDIPTTPKRKLSPDAITPTGKSLRLSTNAEASPNLRKHSDLEQAASSMIGGIGPLQDNGAPDLVRGIGRLEVRAAGNSNHLNTGLELEATGQTPGTEIIGGQPPNIAQRLMSQSERIRTASLGAITTKKTRKANKPTARGRSYSAGTQQKIDKHVIREAKNNNK